MDINANLPHSYEFGPFRMDIREKRLLRAGKPVPLSPKLFDTLQVLLENSGRTLNKSYLIERLWPDSFVEESSLAQNIFQLRKILGEGPLEQYIETIPKRGYRFAASVRVLCPDKMGNLLIQPHLETTLLIEGKAKPNNGETVGASAADQPIKSHGGASRLSRGLFPRFASISFLALVLASGAGIYFWRISRASRPPDTGSDKTRMQPAMRYTRNTEAYQAYVRGRYFWNKRSEEGYRKGLEHFQTAIEIDPSYALAYSGLADCYLFLARDGDGTTAEDNYKRARAAAMRALQIDDTLAEAYTTLATVRSDHDGDWTGAEKAYKQAIDFNPDYPTAHHWYAWDLLTAGRAEEALSEMKKAQELDPLSLNVNTALGQMYYYTGRYEEAAEQCSKTIDLDAHHLTARLYLGMAYEQKGMIVEAVAEYQKVLDQHPNHPAALGASAHAHARMGKRMEAQRIFTELKKIPKSNALFIYQLAVVDEVLGDRGGAVNLLKKISGSRLKSVVVPLKFDPRLDQLRKDPRFTAFL